MKKPSLRKRRFIDAPDAIRCQATITMKDRSLAQCGRRQMVGKFCTQHARIETALESAARAARTKAETGE